MPFEYDKDKLQIVKSKLKASFKTALSPEKVPLYKLEQENAALHLALKQKSEESDLCMAIVQKLPKSCFEKANQHQDEGSGLVASLWNYFSNSDEGHG